MANTSSSLVDRLKKRKTSYADNRRKYKAEYAAEREEIHKALKESFNLKEIWMELFGSGHVTMPYVTFTRYIKEDKISETPKENFDPAKAASSSPEKSPTKEHFFPEKKPGFVLPKDPDPKEYF